MRRTAMGARYTHVTEADRMSIQALLLAKLNRPVIALKLGLSRSTIYREIHRSKATTTARAHNYQAGVAQSWSEERSGARRIAGGATRRKLGSDRETPLWRSVLDGLRSSVPTVRVFLLDRLRALGD